MLIIRLKSKIKIKIQWNILGLCKRKGELINIQNFLKYVYAKDLAFLKNIL